MGLWSCLRVLFRLDKVCFNFLFGSVQWQQAEKESRSLCAHPPTLSRECVSAGVRYRPREKRRGGGRGEQSRQTGRQAGRGGNRRECALVVSLAARLPPSAVEKPVRVASLYEILLKTVLIKSNRKPPTDELIWFIFFIYLHEKIVLLMTNKLADFKLFLAFWCRTADCGVNLLH